MRYVPVHGTGDHTKPDAWFRGGLLVEYLAEHDLTRVLPTFEWSGGLWGVPWDSGKDWYDPAKALWYYLRALPFWDRNLVAHSHGGNVALLTAEYLPIRTLITIGTPVRKDICAVAAKALAKGYIGSWHHVYDKSRDRIQWLGQMFDGRWFGDRAFGLPGMTDHPLKGIGHSKILHQPELFHHWRDEGLIAALRADTTEAA